MPLNAYVSDKNRNVLSCLTIRHALTSFLNKVLRIKRINYSSSQYIDIVKHNSIIFRMENLTTWQTVFLHIDIADQQTQTFVYPKHDMVSLQKALYEWNENTK